MIRTGGLRKHLLTVLLCGWILWSVRPVEGFYFWAISDTFDTKSECQRVMRSRPSGDAKWLCTPVGVRPIGDGSRLVESLGFHLLMSQGK